jgi:hypothetical protein
VHFPYIRRGMIGVLFGAVLFASWVPGATASPAELYANVGRDTRVLLSTPTSRVIRLPVGTYVVTVTDRSSVGNFHLVGVGLNKRTPMRFVGRTTWTLRLRPGTYTYFSDSRRSRVYRFRVI